LCVVCCVLCVVCCVVWSCVVWCVLCGVCCVLCVVGVSKIAPGRGGHEAPLKTIGGSETGAS